MSTMEPKTCRQWRSYTDEFKDATVARVLDERHPCSPVERELDVTLRVQEGRHQARASRYVEPQAVLSKSATTAPKGGAHER